MLKQAYGNKVMGLGLAGLALLGSSSAMAGGMHGSHPFGGKNDQMTCHFDANTRLGPVHVAATGTQVSVAATITLNRQVVDAIGSFGVTNRVQVGQLPTTVNGTRTIEESVVFSGIKGVSMSVERITLGNGPWIGRVTVSSTNPSIGILQSGNAFCDAHPEPQD